MMIITNSNNSSNYYKLSEKLFNIKDFLPRFIRLTLIYKKSIKLHFLQANSPSILRQQHSKRT